MIVENNERRQMMTAAKELGYKDRFPDKYEELVHTATRERCLSIMHWCREHL